MKYTSLQYSRINQKICTANRQLVVANDKKLPVSEWLKEIYLFMQLDYPKFYKMDDFCKLGFLSVELLKKQCKLNQDTNEIALLCVNQYSSLASDLQHQQLIEHGNPSPAVFVYTLPNIALGEIAIRNHWYGEQLCWIKNQWPQELILLQLEVFFAQEKANTVLLGKNDCYNSQLDATWCAVSKKQFIENKEQTIQEIKTIFTLS